MTDEKGAPRSKTMNQFRVAVVAYTEYSWDPRVRREAEILARGGYQVFVVSLRPRSGPSPTHVGGVHLFELPMMALRGGRTRYLYQYTLFLALSTALLLRLHLRKPFDLVHIHSLPDFQVFCAIPLRLRRVPILLDLHEAMPEILAARFQVPMSSLLPRLAAFLEQLSCRFADHVVVANDGIRGVIVSRGVPVNKITTVYNVTAEHTLHGLPDALRARLGLPSGRLLVHAGGINPERDLETLIDAMALLPQDIHLAIAGSGEIDYLEALRDRALRKGLGNRVHFVGKLSMDDAYLLMSLSAVGLVTSQANPLTHIAWPVRIIEFTQLGKPLVVPTLQFIKETLGKGARYYEPGDPSSLADTIQEAIGAMQTRDPTVISAQAVCSQFDSNSMSGSLQSVYTTLQKTGAG